MARKSLAALLASAAALSLASATAQDDEARKEPLRCLSMSTIREYRVVDDRNVLFFQSSDKVYLSRLDRQCLGLARYGMFSYKVQSGARHTRLCDTDSITVLQPGSGLNCGLGRFEPLTQDQVESLIAGPNPAVISVPVQPPEEEEKAPAEPAAEPAPQ